MDYREIVCTTESGVATIILNRPERMNAYTTLMIEELMDAINYAWKADDVRVVVITGAGKGFCSGPDLTTFPPLPDTRPPMECMADYEEGFHKLILRITALDKPIIASINGPAVASGLVLALVCDITIASDRAKFGDGALRFGFVPDEGSTYFLPRAVGLKKALELMFLCEIIDAHEAERIGLVCKVVPDAQLVSATKEMAGRIAEGPPIAQQLAKRAVYRHLDMDLKSSLEDVILAAQVANNTEDAAEGVKAFLEKRPAVFKGK